jgi:hypothetical protein
MDCVAFLFLFFLVGCRCAFLFGVNWIGTERLGISELLSVLVVSHQSFL